MTTDLLLVSAIVGILLPLLVQLLVKAKAPDWVKTVVNLALSAVAAVLAPLLATAHVNWQTTALTFLQVFTLTIVSHYGILKPAGLTGADGVIASLFPGGVGPSPSTAEAVALPIAPVALPVAPVALPVAPVAVAAPAAPPTAPTAAPPTV